MLSYVARRLLWMIPTLVGITVLTFGLLRLAPGDPAAASVMSEAEAADTDAGGVDRALADFRRTHLLDEPLWRQYLHYVGPFDLSARGHGLFGGSGERPWGGLLSGDLKHEYHRPSVSIASELGRRLRVTVPLAALSILLAYLIALPLGIASVLRRGTKRDMLATVLVFLLYSVPTFWAALMLQLAFGATGLDWLPVLGLRSAGAQDSGAWAAFVDLVQHSLLPLACLTYGGFAYLSRQLRAGMLDAIQRDYVRAARAKGLSERVVVIKHVLRNSLIPVLTLFATVLPALIGGSIVVEVVFDLPGMGRYAYEGLLKRDYNVVMATTTFSALLTLAGVLLSDLMYAWADPRIRFE